MTIKKRHKLEDMRQISHISHTNNELTGHNYERQIFQSQHHKDNKI
jgi:hypothetical protein